MRDNPVTASVAKLIADPLSTKDQAYQLGYDAGRLQGIIEAHEQIDEAFKEANKCKI